MSEKSGVLTRRTERNNERLLDVDARPAGPNPESSPDGRTSPDRVNLPEAAQYDMRRHQEVTNTTQCATSGLLDSVGGGKGKCNLSEQC